MIDVNLAPTPAAVSAGEGMREAIARGFYERWVASESDKDAFDWSELPAALKARWYSFADTFSSGPDRQRLVSSAPVGYCPALADRGGTSATVSRGGHADTEGEAMEMFAHLNCPSCGGSGHVDDTREAAGVDGVASVVVPPAASSGEDDLRAAVRAEIINTPETVDFMAGVPLEAAHQRERWGTRHDAGKSPFDWFWLVGYLAQKAADAAVRGDVEKAKHHTISTAAALGNWHAALAGSTDMRPGIGPGNGARSAAAHSTLPRSWRDNP